MNFLVLLIVGIMGAAVVSGISYSLLRKQKGGSGGSSAKLRTEFEHRRGLREQLETLYTQMGEVGVLQKQGRSVITLREALKTERGRITITQAELETVEARLRELEEIERELQASSIDTQEEIKILQKKRTDLGNKNDALKQQISSSLDQMSSALGELEMSAQMQEQIQTIKSDILQTQDKIDGLLIQIEQGNEQYFMLKKRYDALDIEYAQLYEKFSAAEEASKSAAAG